MEERRPRLSGPGLALLALALLATGVAAQDGRTMRIVYAYAAGNSGDTICRIVADRLAKRRGQSTIVENRGGASGRVGTRAVIAAPPDGDTLLCTPMAPIVLHPVTHANLGYEPFEALAPVSQIATFDIGVTVGPAVPVKSIGELISWVKVDPARGAYGTPGLGGLPQFFAVMFAANAGLQLRNVPYPGTGALMNDLVSGQLSFAVVPTADMSELHRSGKVRILASSGSRVSPMLPDVPTFKSAGFDITGEGWQAIYAPAGTPREVISRLSADVQAVMQETAVRERFAKLGYVPTGTTAEALGAQQRADRVLWTPAIKASGFKPSD